MITYIYKSLYFLFDDRLITIGLLALYNGHPSIRDSVLTFTPPPNLAPGVIKFTIFGRPFLGHHTCTILSVCLGVEKKNFKEILHFYCHALTQGSLPLGLWNLNLVLTYLWLSLLNTQFVWSLPGGRKEDF